MKLFGVRNTKTEKGLAAGYSTAICHMAPHNQSGYNVCQHASAGCSWACLNTSGRGGMKSVQDARVRKTRLFFENRAAFRFMLEEDILTHIRRSGKKGLIPAFRLNGTSDLPYERIFPDLFDKFSDVQFYDYTKVPGRETPDNYDLTFSRSETNEDVARAELARGLNVAVVFAELPETYWGVPVISGEEDDLRFRDPKPSIVGLTAKGRAKKDASGFVVHPEFIPLSLAA